VAELSRAIALRMGMPEREADGIEMAGLLHDVGKMAIPAEILTKSGALSEAEYALIKGHPQQGHDMLKGIAFPWPIADAVLQHHERADGSGYPGGLRNAETLVSARIIAVADVLEAMAGERPYRRALGMEAAMAEIRDHPAAYDPEVAAAALSICGSGDFTFAR
jgi:putative nucleotidyltransferase with HDIG domain